MKKMIAILSAATVLFGVLTLSAAARDYSDVSQSHKYFKAIDYISEQNIVQGYNDGSFKPESTLNRAELLKIVVESTYSDEEIGAFEGKECFNDVSSDEWFSNYVCLAKDEGIVKGYGDGTFKPAQDIIFVEALKISMKANKFAYQEGEIWYKDLVDQASSRNLIPTDVERFDQDFSRGQMAEMITRTMKKKEDKLDQYLGEEMIYNVSYDTIENGDAEEVKSKATWGWKKATSPTDAHNFINGLEGYSSPHAVQTIAGAGNDLYLFYRGDIESSDDWGWKLAPTMDDAYNFLNRKGAYTGDPIANIQAAQNDNGTYIFYSGRDEDASWGWKKATTVSDMYNFKNGYGSYGEPKYGSLSGLSSSESYMFYRADAEVEDGWAWKKATSISDAYNFLNGLGSYGDPIEAADIFAADSDTFYIFYNSTVIVNPGPDSEPDPEPINPEPINPEPQDDYDVTFELSVNDYPEHHSYGQSENIYAYVNVYEVTVENNTYKGTRIDTLHTYANSPAEYTVEPGQIVDFVGFKKGTNAEAATEWDFTTPPYKNFHGDDELCQINYFETDEYLQNDPDYACAMSLSTPYVDITVTYEVGVNDYPDHEDSDLTQNIPYAYVNFYEVTPISPGVYEGVLIETQNTGADAGASFDVEYGQIVNFVGFIDEDLAEDATEWTFSSPPYKNFGDWDRLSQINYLNADEKLTLSVDGSYSSAMSSSKPYQTELQ